MPTGSLAPPRPPPETLELEMSRRGRGGSLAHALARWHRDALWCAAGAVIVAVYIAWAIGARLAWWTLTVDETGVAVNTTMVVLYLIAALLQWRAAHSPHLDSATRSAWRLMFATNAGAFALSGSGAVRAVLGISTAGGMLWQLAQPTIYIATNAAALLALFRFPVSPKSKSDRATFWLDAGTVGCAAMLLAWHLLFRGAIASTPGGALHAAEALAYPASDVMLLFAVLALLLRRPLSSSATALRVFALAAGISVVADIPTVFDVLAQGAAQAEPYFILYVIAAWLYGAAAYVQTRNAERDAAQPPDPARSRVPSYSVLPYIAVALVYIALFVQAYHVVHARVGAKDIGSSAAALLALVTGAAVVTGFVVARQIVAVRRNAELVADRLAREAYFRALVERSSDMYVVVERDGSIREASPAFARAVAATPDDLHRRAFVDCLDDADRGAARADLDSAASRGESRAFQWRLATTNRWIEVVCTNLLTDGAVGALVLNGRDITERKQLERQLLHRADHDPLTGLANRRTFVAQLARAAERLADGTAAFAVLYVDLDGFKPINDRHGHAAGDAVLLAVAERLKSATRGSDLVARLGGDEFGLYLDGASSRDEIDAIVARVLSAMRRPIPLPGNAPAVTVGCSIGVALAPTAAPTNSADPSIEHGAPSPRRDAEALLNAADAAMYAAKVSGGARHGYATAISA